MKVFSCVSFKGGTAKTSTLLHLGAVLASEYDKRVLLVDFDPQANLTCGLGFSLDQTQTMVAALRGEMSMQEVIQKSKVPNLDIVAANIYLDGIESTHPLVSDLYAHERLRRLLMPLAKQYDFVFIDTPPSLGWLTQSALFAADYSLIAAIPEPYSLLALSRLKEVHSAISEHHSLTMLGVILTFWDSRGATNQAYLESIEAAFPGALFEARVRRDVHVSRAILKGDPVTLAFPSSRAAGDYRALVQELLKRLDPNKNQEAVEVGYGSPQPIS